MLTTPEVVLRPNSVPCGPRRTSIRSRSKYSVSNRRVPNSGALFKWIAVALSQLTPTHRSPMPRMVKLELVKLLLVNETLGRVSCKSLAFSICCASSASWVNALTAIGTLCSDSARRWAVTTMTLPLSTSPSTSSGEVSWA